MATNGFSKEEIVFFNDVLQGFEPNNITAKQVSKFMAPSTQFERAGLTINRPVPYISTTTTGLTIVPEDKTQLSVPSSLNSTTDIHNVPFTMNAIELQDPQQRDRIVQSALIALSAKADNIIATKVAQEGTIVVTDAAALTTYNQIAAAETPMTLNDVPIMEPRTLIMNANDYNGVSGDLAQRDAPPTGVSLTAFERSIIPSVATFDSFKASFMPSIAAAAGGATLIDGANQRHIPLATDANGQNVDNRSMDLVVDNNVGIVVGDAFTIPGVNAVSLIHKNDTGNLQTFRVLAVNVDGVTLTISPAIVVAAGSTEQSEIDYANCSAVPIDTNAIAFLNIATSLANIFFINSAVEIIHGQLSDIDLNGAGVSTMVESTDSGIQMLFAKGADVTTLETTYRLTMWMNATILNPQMCGVILGGQT